MIPNSVSFCFSDENVIHVNLKKYLKKNITKLEQEAILNIILELLKLTSESTIDKCDSGYYNDDIPEQWELDLNDYINKKYFSSSR